MKESEFRIVEYKDHFEIEKKYKDVVYWHFLGLYPIFIKEVKDDWHAILKNGYRRFIRDYLNFDRYHFKTKEECLQWIEDYYKYPIYHEVK